MKITENISLAGFAFTIESDAYSALEQYINDIRTSFEGNASADEIIADIEERMAEILSEQCHPGTTVSLKHVEELKSRIGDPHEFAPEQNSTNSEGQENQPKDQTEQEKRNWNGKRLYRDIDERVLGGVCSGLGAFFGIDKVILRLVFIALLLGLLFGNDEGLFLIIALAYVCLWIAMPAARTVEQKCELKGKPIRIDSYRKGDFDLKKEAKEVSQSPAGKTVKRAGGAFLGILLLLVGLSGLLACIFIPALPEIITNMSPDWGLSDKDNLWLSSFLSDRTFWILTLAMCGILFVWFIYNGVTLTFGLKTPSWKPGLVLFILWIISIFVIAAWTIKEVAEYIPSIVV